MNIVQGVNQGVAFVVNFSHFAGPESGGHEKRGKTHVNLTKIQKIKGPVIPGLKF